MASKGSQAKQSAQPLGASSPDQIRNVVLVGPSGSGKTTLTETLLVTGGALPRAGSVRDGGTVTDHEEAEHRHQRSMSLAVAPVVHRGIKINLLDTPGYADFVGEVRAGLRAADCALFVIAAGDDIDPATRMLWRECAEVLMPRVIVADKLDALEGDWDSVVTKIQDAFGEKAVPIFLVDREGSEVTGLTSLLEGGPDDVRAGVIEAVIEESEDETLMDRYLAGEEVSVDTLVADLETAVARASFHPIIPVCSGTGVGTRELLDLMVAGFPSPAEHPVPEVFTTAGATAGAVTCDPDGPLVAEIVKTTSDPYVGRVSIVRVFSGRLQGDLPVHVSGHFAAFGESGHEDHDEDEKIGGLSHPFGAAVTPTQEVVAGDICAVTRLSRAETGDTLSGLDEPVVLKPWHLPEPLLPIAITAASKADEDKMMASLARVAAEDPSVRITNDAETGQLVVWTMGESHAEVVIERLESRFGVHVEQVPFLVSLRETLAGKASALGRHVKQSGGHGQYAVCHIEVEPLPEGAGFEFVDKVVGGAVPRNYIPSVEKGVRMQMDRGLRLGFPVQDLRVTLTDGKAHSVDSSDMAFQTAGALALREAAASAGVRVLEPYDDVTVTVPDDLIGMILSDLSSRRAKVLGTDTSGDGLTQVRAHVPQTELVRYLIDLRSSTHGAGAFTRTFDHYEPMPEEQAAKAQPREHH